MLDNVLLYEHVRYEKQNLKTFNRKKVFITAKTQGNLCKTKAAMWLNEIRRIERFTAKYILGC